MELETVLISYAFTVPEVHTSDSPLSSGLAHLNKAAESVKLKMYGTRLTPEAIYQIKLLARALGQTETDALGVIVSEYVPPAPIQAAIDALRVADKNIAESTICASPSVGPVSSGQSPESEHFFRTLERNELDREKRRPKKTNGNVVRMKPKG